MSTTTMTIINGDDRSIRCEFTNSDGTAVDITGATVFFTVKRRPTDADDDAVISKSVTSHENAVGGITYIALAPADTTLDEGNYFYDFQLKDSDSKIRSSRRGLFVIVQDITRRTT